MRGKKLCGAGFGFNANGWGVLLTGNVNQWLGVTGDFGGVYKSVSGADLHIYTYGGGPVINLNHSGVVNPFVHALFGGARLGGAARGGAGGTNRVTMIYVGGADVVISKMFALRVPVDWPVF